MAQQMYYNKSSKVPRMHQQIVPPLQMQNSESYTAQNPGLEGKAVAKGKKNSLPNFRCSNDSGPEYSKKNINISLNIHQNFYINGTNSKKLSSSFNQKGT